LYLSAIEVFVLILVTLLAISLVFNVASIVESRKKQRTNKKTKSLKTEKIVEKPITNRRKSFRINFMEENKKCHVNVFKIGNEVVEDSIEGEGRLVDISGTGMRLLLEHDLPIRKVVEIEMDFELEKEKFYLKGQLLRKIESFKDKQITYGVEFKNMQVTDENRLIRIIMAISRDKKRTIVNKRPEVKRAIVK
jgi:hypothetical protein